MFWLQVWQVRGNPPWYGLTMEGWAHPLCYVGNSFMSRHHKARCMEGAARYITQHTACIIHHITYIHPSVRNASFHKGEGKRMMMMMMIMMMCVCVLTLTYINPGMFLCVLQPSVQNAPFHRGGG